MDKKYTGKILDSPLLRSVFVGCAAKRCLPLSDTLHDYVFNWFHSISGMFTNNSFILKLYHPKLSPVMQCKKVAMF